MYIFKQISHKLLAETFILLISDMEFLPIFASMTSTMITIMKHLFYIQLQNFRRFLIEPFKFRNDNDGFCKLLAVLNKYDKSSLIIGLESTAHYGNNLVEFLVNRQFQVAVINPIQTSSMRKNRIRKTKTDKVDATIIAQSLMMQPYRLCSKYDIDLMHLKNLGRFRQKLMK